MNLTDLFVSRAEAAGVEVARISLDELPGRLAALLGECGPVALADLAGDPDLAKAVGAALSMSGATALTSDDFHLAGLGVTKAFALLAETGSQVVHSDQPGAMKASLLPPVHLALAREEDIREDSGSLLAEIAGSLPARMVFVTGPSRTGDIEATMTTGVHGPGRVMVWLVDG